MSQTVAIWIIVMEELSIWFIVIYEAETLKISEKIPFTTAEAAKEIRMCSFTHK